MIQGYFKIYVLKELSRKPLTGYDLMKSIEEITGKKPSPGTMYPLLGELSKKNLICVKKQENKKIYSLTPLGKKKFQMFITEKKKFAQKRMILLRDVFNPKEMKALEFMFSDKKKPVQKEDFCLLHLLKGTVIEFITAEKDEKTKEQFREIIKDTIYKIKKLR